MVAGLPQVQSGLNFFVSAYLGGFAKLQQATVNVVMSVCPSVCLSARNNLAPTRQIFMKFVIFVLLENLSSKFKFL